MALDPEALTAAINIVRDNPSLQWAETTVDVARSKFLADIRIRRWAKTLTCETYDKKWNELYLSACRLDDHDKARITYHWVASEWKLRHSDLSDAPELIETLRVHCLAAMHLGMSSKVSCRVAASISTLNKDQLSKYRRRLLTLGYLRGTSGTPATEGKRGSTGVIKIPAPEWNEVPRQFQQNWEDWLELSDSDIYAMNSYMNKSREQSLMSSNTLSAPGKDSLRRTRAALTTPQPDITPSYAQIASVESSVAAATPDCILEGLEQEPDAGVEGASATVEGASRMLTLQDLVLLDAGLSFEELILADEGRSIGEIQSMRVDKFRLDKTY